MSMTIDQFRERMATGEPIIGISASHVALLGVSIR